MTVLGRLKRVLANGKIIRVSDITSTENSSTLNDLQSPTDTGSIETLPASLSLPPNYKVLETYDLTPPYASAKVIQDPVRGNIVYIVKEPKMAEEELSRTVDLRGLLTQVFDVSLNDISSKEDAKAYLSKKLNEVILNHRYKIEPLGRERLQYYMVRDHLGFGKIDPLMHDPFIEDISCDGVNIPLYIWHRKYESVPTNIVFPTEEELDSFTLRLAYLCGRHISIAQPMLDASLPEGSRINLTYSSEVTRKGSTFTIRKFKLDPLTIVDLINYKTLSAEMAAYFWYAVEHRISILVSGGIAAGKTTTLNCLSMFIEPDLKIVSIEDTPELNLPHMNWIPSITRTHFGLGADAADISLFQLLQASLRQRPDYIIVGEVRGEEAYTLFQAISTGHLGMSTIHGESVDAVVYRLESEPMNIPRTLIAGIDVITVQKRVQGYGKPSRRLVSTAEIVGLDPRSREILTNEVFQWNAETDGFDFTGRSYLVERISEKNGISLEEANKEINRRKVLLESLAKHGIRDYVTVSNMVRRYYENPEEAYREAQGS